MRLQQLDKKIAWSKVVAAVLRDSRKANLVVYDPRNLVTHRLYGLYRVNRLAVLMHIFILCIN